MTTRSIFSAFFLITLSATGFAQSTGKTFSKSFNTDNKTILRLDLPGTVELKVWDNPSIHITFTVNSPSANAGFLNELATVGRYNLVSATEGEKLVVRMPNIQRQVKVKGQELKETFSFTVFVPKSAASVEMPNQQALAENK